MNLHILNGDSSLDLFMQTPIKGKAISWGEILCEGPVVADIFTEENRFLRYGYLRDRYGSTKSQFYSKVWQPIETLRDARKYESIYLWFEYDLFCHINLLAICHSLLKSADEKQKIYLICPTEQRDGHPVSLGELDASDYVKLYIDAEEMSRAELSYLSDIWLDYTGDDPRELIKYLNKSDRFPFISQILKAHFHRFPKRESGIDSIRYHILHTVHTHELESKKALLKKLLIDKDYYGYGDLQYAHLIEELSIFIEEGPILYLNPIGKSLLAGKIDYTEYHKETHHLGGTLNNRYRWWEEKSEFIPQFHESKGYA